LGIAVWPALIAFAAGSARGQAVQVDDEEPAAARPPSIAPAAPAAPAPPGVRHPRVGLMIAGAVLFTATWVPTVIASAGGNNCGNQACRESFEVGWYPVLGPFLAWEKTSNQEGSIPLSLALLWTAAEAAGVVMAVVGLIGRPVPVAPLAKSSWRITPILSPAAAGLSVGGIF
jgi:hypothetical protein